MLDVGIYALGIVNEKFYSKLKFWYNPLFTTKLGVGKKTQYKNHSFDYSFKNLNLEFFKYYKEHRVCRMSI